jgi:hypothetical protein
MLEDQKSFRSMSEAKCYDDFYKPVWSLLKASKPVKVSKAKG